MGVRVCERARVCGGVRGCESACGVNVNAVHPTHPNSNYERPHVCGQKIPTYCGVRVVQWCMLCAAETFTYFEEGFVLVSRDQALVCAIFREFLVRVDGHVLYAVRVFILLFKSMRSSTPQRAVAIPVLVPFERDDVIRKAHVSRKREQEAGGRQATAPRGHPRTACRGFLIKILIDVRRTCYTHPPTTPRICVCRCPRSTFRM